MGSSSVARLLTRGVRSELGCSAISVCRRALGTRAGATSEEEAKALEGHVRRYAPAAAATGEASGSGAASERRPSEMQVGDVVIGASGAPVRVTKRRLRKWRKADFLAKQSKHHWRLPMEGGQNLPLPLPRALQDGWPLKRKEVPWTDPVQSWLEQNQVDEQEAKNDELLVMKCGLPVDLIYRMPHQVKALIVEPTVVCLYGTDKNQVTQLAAKLRAYKPPNPYKGHGIRILGETVVEKERKKMK